MTYYLKTTVTNQNYFHEEIKGRLISRNSRYDSVENLLSSLLLSRNRDSAVGIATGYGFDDGCVGVQVPVGSRIFSSPRRLDRLWGPPSLLLNGYRGIFTGGKAAGG
jgi:hypothetical protein